MRIPALSSYFISNMSCISHTYPGNVMVKQGNFMIKELANKVDDHVYTK